MDLTMIDVTELPATRVGDAVALIGGWGDRGMGVFLREIMGCAERPSHQNAATITAEEVAAWADSIGHELLCRIGERVPRVYLDSTLDSALDSTLDSAGTRLADSSAETDLAEPAP